MKHFVRGFVLLIGVSTVLTGCGSDGDSGPSVEFDGGVLYGANCVPCHAADTSDVDGTTVEEITAAIAVPGSPMTTLGASLAPEELTAIADFLATDMHAEGWRRSGNHGHYAEDNGVALCELCHGGPSLGGDGEAPTCFKCHGRKW